MRRITLAIFIIFSFLDLYSQKNYLQKFPEAYDMINPYFDIESDQNPIIQNGIKTWTKYYKNDSDSLVALFTYNYDKRSRIISFESFDSNGFSEYSYKVKYYNDSVIKEYSNKEKWSEIYYFDTLCNLSEIKSSNWRILCEYDNYGYLKQYIRFNNNQTADTFLFSTINKSDTILIYTNDYTFIYDKNGNLLESQFFHPDSKGKICSKIEHYYVDDLLQSIINIDYNPERISRFYFRDYGSKKRIIKETVISDNVLDTYEYNYVDDYVIKERYKQTLFDKTRNYDFVHKFIHY